MLVLARDDLPVVVSRPPHILCDAARKFAIYSDEFIVVGARQPAIAGPRDEADFLKVLSLYLSSDFAKYHQIPGLSPMGHLVQSRQSWQS